MSDRYSDLLDQYEQEYDKQQREPEQWGRYHAIALIQKSRTRSIYHVRDNLSNKEYLLKDYYGNTDHLVREASILARLDYPFIPKVIETFTHDDKAVLVREYVHGKTLESILSERGSFKENDALHIILKLLEILKYLHHLSPLPIVHRDIKPANLVIDENNQVHLIDFDSAREYKPHVSSDTQYLGTQGYAAPEQYGHSQTDPRSDIYSVGVVLYRLLTGAVLDDGISLSKDKLSFHGMSKQTSRILGRCLEFDPIRRYQSVDELIKAVWVSLKGTRNLNVGILASIVTLTLILIVAVFINYFSIPETKEAPENTLVGESPPENLDFGLLVKSATLPYSTVTSHMGQTGDGGPDWDFDGTVEVFSYIFWEEKLELYVGWRNDLQAFNLNDALPQKTFQEDGTPKRNFKMELINIDLDDDGILELIVATGDTKSEMGLSIVWMNQEEQTFHICDMRLSGGPFAYIDEDKNIVVPAHDGIIETKTYTYQQGRLIEKE